MLSLVVLTDETGVLSPGLEAWVLVTSLQALEVICVVVV